MAKQSAGKPQIRTTKNCVIAGSVYFIGKTIEINDGNRVEVQAAVKRGEAAFVNDANPADNSTNA